MSKKAGNIFEQFVDKITLVLAGLICLWLLFTHILGGPNTIKYNGQKLAPGHVDSYILNEKATLLDEKLATAPKEDKDYEPKIVAFNSDLKHSIKNVNFDAHFPLPGSSQGKIEPQSRTYRAPKVTKINDVNVALVKMVAYVPTEEVGPKLTYAEVDTKLEDVDLVTVEGQIDITELYSRFRSSFAESAPRADMYNEQYTKPVFAAVQLQRQEMSERQKWNDWQDIPKTKICYLKESLEIPNNISELDYGIEFNLAKFSKVEFRNEILQPAVYDDAIGTIEWISPGFYIERQERLAEQERNKERERLEAEKLRKISESRGVRSGGRKRETSRAPAGGGMPGIGGQQRQPQERTRKETVSRPKGTRTSIDRKLTKEDAPTEEEKFETIKLTEDEDDVSSMEELVFWAHDDTTEPGKQYRYRIRIGIFNPVAGKDCFVEEQKDMQNKVVLWSDFSDATETINIPSRLAIFPTDIREIDKSVTVQVSKYQLGQWHSEDFKIRPGEIIGKVVANALIEESKTSNLELNPKEIDYSTGAVYIDAVRVNEWSGAGVLRPKDYYKMLYTRQGNNIEYLVIKSRYWSATLVASFKEIKKMQTDEALKLQQRGTRKGYGGRQQGQDQMMGPEGMPMPGMMGGLPDGRR